MSHPAAMFATVEQVGIEPSREPENRLMLAVLEEALVTFQRGLNSPVPERRKRFCEVDKWVSEKDSDWPFSFENICQTLRIDPDYIRAGLRTLKCQSLLHRSQSRGRKLRRERIYDRRGWRGHIK
ncbi:MAG TPA: hypothetical protein VN634_05690 [Candidatus Limnocylindrales bacterium]|nr:hypothetical protein [Candidatus Limnocylindrales bacterium]